MKIKIELNKFRKFLENAMLFRQNKPSIEPGVFIFGSEKVINKGIYLTSFGTYQEYKKEFFKEYNVPKDEVIAIPKSIPELLKWNFDKDLEIETNKSKLVIEGGSHMEPDLENAEPCRLPWNFTLTEYGLLPIFNFNHDPEWDKKTVDPQSVFEVDIKDLKLPPVGEYSFEYIDGELTLKVAQAQYSTPIKGSPIKKKNIRFSLDADYFNTIIANVEGKINLIFNSNMIVICENDEYSNKTYFLATNNE